MENKNNNEKNGNNTRKNISQIELDAQLKHNLLQNGRI